MIFDPIRILREIRRACLPIAMPVILFSGAMVCSEEVDEQVVASFASHVDDADFSAEQKSSVKQLIEEFSDSAADAITESLVVLYPKYAAAIESTDEGDVDASARQFESFVTHSDKYLAADACFYLGRAYMNEERFEQSLALLARVHGELEDYNVHVGQARFYTGIAQAGLLRYEDAVQTLSDFLQFYPTAPERLRVAAWRQIQQLRSIESGQMEDVYQRMDYSRRKLSLNDPGEKTQDEQDKIVKMLAKLIKEQEKKEASQSQQQQQQQQNTQKQQQQQQQSKSQQQNQSETGGQSNNPNGKVVKKAYNDGPASPWSRLRERSRDPANNAIKDKLPARYRDIVERYYEAANGDSKNN